MSIYVGNLSFEVTNDDLTQAFEKYGAVKKVYMPEDKISKQNRGFAFVDLETDAEELAAISEMDGTEWMGRDIKVNKAKPRNQKKAAAKKRRKKNNASPQA